MKESLKQAVLWDEVKDILDQSAMTLSGGQQQRLCIARALAMKPDILLMDEPTSALDPISTAKIEELIDELKKQYTIIIVTHNMQQAARVSEHTGFFYIGKADRVQHHRKDLHQSGCETDGRIYYRAVRLKRGESMEEKQHTSREYERELQEIKDGLLYLGAMTERAIDRGVKALLERDSDLARQVICDDDQIDKIDVEIEEKCIRLLALRQPAARDLRFITTAIKINGHLERIGDMAVQYRRKGNYSQRSAANQALHRSSPDGGDCPGHDQRKPGCPGS